MQEDRLTWLLRKGMIALPVILVLALARCGVIPPEWGRHLRGRDE